MNTFVDRLKRLRNEAGLSQEQLAERLQLSRPAIGHYETGFRKPDLDTLQCIARFFDVSTDYLLGRTDDPTPPSADLSDVLSTDEAITLAFSKVGGPLAELSPEAIRSVKEYIEFVHERERREAKREDEKNR